MSGSYSKPRLYHDWESRKLWQFFQNYQNTRPFQCLAAQLWGVWALLWDVPFVYANLQLKFNELKLCNCNWLLIIVIIKRLFYRTIIFEVEGPLSDGSRSCRPCKNDVSEILVLLITNVPHMVWFNVPKIHLPHIPEFDTKLNGITLFQIPLLHCVWYTAKTTKVNYNVAWSFAIVTVSSHSYHTSYACM